MKKADAFEVALKLLGVYAGWRVIQNVNWIITWLLEGRPSDSFMRPEWHQPVIFLVAMIVLIKYGRAMAVWLAGRQEDASGEPAMPGARLGFWIAVLGAYFVVSAWMNMMRIPLLHWRGFWEIAGLAVSFVPGVVMLLWGHRIGGWIEARWAKQSSGVSAEGR